MRMVQRLGSFAAATAMYHSLCIEQDAMAHRAGMSWKSLIVPALCDSDFVNARKHKCRTTVPGQVAQLLLPTSIDT